MALKIWLPLVGNTNNQGLEDVTITNSNATVESNGKIGKCYYFNGTNARISCSSFSCQYPMTIAGWIKPTDVTNTNTQYWISYNTATGGTAGHTIGLGTYQGKYAVWYGGNVSTITEITSAIENDKWYHFALVITQDKNVYAYLNGEQKKHLTFTAIPPNSVWFTVGARSNSSTGGVGGAIYYLKGYANDVRFYDDALSEKEIEVLARGLVLHYPLYREEFGQNNIIPSTTFVERQYTYPASSHSDKYSVVTAVIPSASQYTLSFYAKSTVNGDKIRTHYYSPNTTTTCVSSQGITKNATDGNMDFTLTTEWKLYWVTYSQNETTTAKHVICPRLVSGNGSGTVSVKMVKLEEGDKPTSWIPNSNDDLYGTLELSGTLSDINEEDEIFAGDVVLEEDAIIYDVSGYNHNGTAHNITYNADTPQYNVCCVFNGTDSYIKVNDNTWMSQGTTELTVNEWAYTADWTAQTNPRLFSCTEGGGFNTEAASSGYIRFPVHTYSDAEKTKTAYRYNNTFIKLADLESGWHMFTFIYTLTGTKVYIDGKLYNTYNYATYGIHYNLNARLFLGCEASGANPTGTYFNGKLSDFRLYATALSPEAILELYHTGASLANNGVLMTNQFVEV